MIRTKKKKRPSKRCSKACRRRSKISSATPASRPNGELVIKRIVNRSGKNRIYLNGSLCPLTLLAEIGSFLVHIYGQHEHHTLLQPETHLNLLDAFADMAALRADDEREVSMRLADAWQRPQRSAAVARTAAPGKRLARSPSRGDRPGAAQARRGGRAPREARIFWPMPKSFIRAVARARSFYTKAKPRWSSRLGKYAVRLRELATIDHDLQPTVELLDSSLAQLQEAAAQLRRYAERVHFDPRRAWNKSKTAWPKSSASNVNTTASVDEILRMHEEIKDIARRAWNRAKSKSPALEKAFAAARNGRLGNRGKSFTRPPARGKKTQTGDGKRGEGSRDAGDHVRGHVLSRKMKKPMHRRFLSPARNSPNAAWIRWNSIFRRIPENRRNRWPRSLPAASSRA